MMSDPIADMLTRIRNAQMVGKTVTSFPNSRIKRAILDVLKEEGYIVDYKELDDKRDIEVTVKYYLNRPVIEKIKRSSHPSLRRYASVKNIPLVRNGLGISILSTPRGVISDHRARELHVGGEILCEIY